MGTIAKLGQRLKSFFKGKGKPNLKKVNLSEVNINPISHSTSHGPNKLPKGVIPTKETGSAFKATFRCNRAYLTQSK